MVVVCAFMAVQACGSGPVNEAHTAPTDAPVSTTATASSTTLDPVVSAVASTNDKSPTTTAPRPTCSTYYRASVTVPPAEGPLLALTTSGISEANFTDLHLTATYTDDGFDVPSLNIRVESLPDRALIFASLYQFADPRVDLNAFAATGQGFTGLMYVYNPASGSELQFFCSSE